MVTKTCKNLTFSSHVKNAIKASISHCYHKNTFKAIPSGPASGNATFRNGTTAKSKTAFVSQSELKLTAWISPKHMNFYAAVTRGLLKAQSTLWKTVRRRSKRSAQRQWQGECHNGEISLLHVWVTVQHIFFMANISPICNCTHHTCIQEHNLDPQFRNATKLAELEACFKVADDFKTSKQYLHIFFTYIRIYG